MKKKKKKNKKRNEDKERKGKRPPRYPGNRAKKPGSRLMIALLYVLLLAVSVCVYAQARLSFILIFH